MQHRLFTLAAAALWVVVSVVSAWAGDGRRLALVVGNSDYANVGDLPNAARDAAAIALSLERLGFEVVTLQDASLAQLSAAVDDMSTRAEGADATLFFYSGHGFQLSGNNYVVPVDAVLTARDQIDAQTMRLNDIIGRLQSANRPTLILLDACRDNPLPASVRETTTTGLAQIEKGDGVFVAFATQPGDVTFDGAGDHSPFTQALLGNIERPGLSVSDMMIHVRKSVLEQTLSRQTPWEQSNLRDAFFFNPATDLNSSLTDAERLELASLSPEMQRKFEQRFGITIEAIDEPAPAPAPASPGIIFSDASDPLPAEDSGSEVAAEPPGSVEPAGPVEPPEIGLPVEPAVTDDPVASDDAVPLEQPEAPAVPADDPILAIDPPVVDVAVDVAPDNEPEATATNVAAVVNTNTPTVAGTGTSGAMPVAGSTTQQPSTSAEPGTIVVANLQTAPRSTGAGQGVAPVVGTTRTVANAVTGVSASATPAVVTPTPVTNVLVGTEVPQQGEPLEPETIEVALADPQVPLPDPGPAVPADIVSAVQTELKRVGCYTSRVDGDWGNGSARALMRYYVNKNADPIENSATAALYLTLLEEDGRVCPVEVAPTPPKVTASNNGGSTPSRPAATAAPKATPTPAPAAKTGFGFGSGSFR